MTRYIYGEDPASQNDFFGIVIHEMPSPTQETPKPVPILRDLYQLNHTSFDKIIEFHTSVLFPKCPPSLMVFDYTNERTFTDLMEDRYFGEDSRKIKPKIFLSFVFLELLHMYQLLLLQELANQGHHKHFHLYCLCLEQSPCMLQI